MLHNVLPIYTCNTYKLVDICITLGSHKLLQTCDPPPSFSLLVSNVLKVQKVANKLPIITNDVTFAKLFHVTTCKSYKISTHTSACAHTCNT